jgi:hypothetical protein
MQMNLENLSHEQKEALAEDCEDFLLHRNIPLHSHSYDNIINQALKEGYQITKFDRYVNAPRTPAKVAQDDLRTLFDAL